MVMYDDFVLCEVYYHKKGHKVEQVFFTIGPDFTTIIKDVICT